jgi:hypothetical protein
MVENKSVKESKKLCLLCGPWKYLVATKIPDEVFHEVGNPTVACVRKKERKREREKKKDRRVKT